MNLRCVVVPSTRIPGVRSLRLRQGDRLASPLIEAMRKFLHDRAQDFEVGDVLEISCTLVLKGEVQS